MGRRFEGRAINARHNRLASAKKADERVYVAGTGYKYQLVDYVFDDLGRLTQEEHDLPGTADDWQIDYGYDVVGNRLSNTRTKGGAVVETVTDKYNALDQLYEETVTGGTDAGDWDLLYDLNGSLISKSRGGTVVSTYGYDLQNRLQATSLKSGSGFSAITDATRYAYNEHGVRTQEIVWHNTGSGFTSSITSTTHLIDAHNPTGYANALEERTLVASVPTTNLPQTLPPVTPTTPVSVSYAYGLGLLEQKAITSVTTVSYFLTDHQGTTRQLTSDSGGVTATYYYDAYGNFVDLNGNSVPAPTATTKLFAMLTYDPASKLHYALARFLDTGSGRFVSQDPYEGDLSIPGSLHDFLYAYSDPVNRSDPSGRIPPPFTPPLFPITRADSAIAYITAHRTDYSQAAKSKLLVLLNEVDRDILGTPVTQERRQMVASLVSKAYIDAVIDFLTTHPGATAMRGRRSSLADKLRLENEFNAPWCDDWARGISASMALNANSVFRNNDVNRVLALVPAQWNGRPNGNGDIQHNWNIILPQGIRSDGRAFNADVNSSPDGNVHPGVPFVHIDPWYTLMPDVYEGAAHPDPITSLNTARRLDADVTPEERDLRRKLLYLSGPQ